MSDEQRHSVASDIQLLTDPDAVARKEAANALAQFDETLDLIEDVVRGRRPFRLRPSMVLGLHRTALAGLSAYAGVFRPGEVTIGQSQHKPPPALRVSALVEDMCDDVNAQFAGRSALFLCARVMWELNWIHPFTDGNGRTSRAVAYYVLCAKLGYRLPGHSTIPEQIAADKRPYYEALEAADLAYAAGQLDVSRLEELLGNGLTVQLASALNDASDPAAGLPDARRFH